MINSSQNRIWLIYCWHEIEEEHLPRIFGIKQAIESEGWEVHLECMDFTVGKRFREQIDDKIFELKLYSNLTVWDPCIFLVSHNVLDGGTFLEEQAYASDQPSRYPKGSNLCIGLMYL